MAKVKGLVFRIYGNSGTHAVPVYVTIGGSRNGTLDLTMSPIDVTDKDSNDWKELLAGVKEWEVSGEIVYDEGDAAIAQIKADCLAGTKTKVKMKTLDSNEFVGSCFVTKLNWASPHDGAVSANATFTGTGELTDQVAS